MAIYKAVVKTGDSDMFEDGDIMGVFPVTHVFTAREQTSSAFRIVNINSDDFPDAATREEICVPDADDDDFSPPGLEDGLPAPARRPKNRRRRYGLLPNDRVKDKRPPGGRP